MTDMTKTDTSDTTVAAGAPDAFAAAKSGAAAGADWWREAVIYQIYPRSFRDMDGDGDGDLAGVIDRLDYLKALGVDAVWLSPFYPSPLADGGYDVADYRAVDPRLGTMAQFDELVARAHALGIRVIVDIVPNHTSDQHRWFQEALRDGPESPAAARYVFRRGKGEHGELPPTNWLSNFGGSAWEPCVDGWYYLHLFAKEQPDLNWDNPEVHAEFLDVLRFWCDKGVDGFRVDVSHGLAKDLREPLRDRPDPTVMSPQAADGSDPLWDRDAVHGIYREWRELFDRYDPPKYAIGESWSPFTPRIFQYAQPDELGAVFDFSMSKAAWNRGEYRETIDRTHRFALEAGTAPTWVLGNHDVPRIASRLGLPPHANIEQWVTSNGTNPPIDPALAARRARAAALVELGLPGTAFVYQGEEFGLPEDFDLTEDEIQDPNWERSGHYFKGRDGCRVPLPWTADGPAFGFNDTGAAWLPQPAWFARYAADMQEHDDASTLTMYRRAIALRRDWVVGSGPSAGDAAASSEPFAFDWLDESEYPAPLLGWRLPSGMTVVANYADTDAVTLPQEMTVLVSSDGSVAPGATVGAVPPATTLWCR
ncbi:alpha-amylase family glycosyl hydrolase [Bifidobacterium saguinibicoloris]|uniref:glycoside hydrolase family 13 protein n=1 Tax=Bifidobacterium saguinibicoloris TaxID=2834433 RepID=UPI001C56D7A0|nr:alpha-amylase family glycosyl hydrolase [Bifidobacterium saguinibicoloris]MBW3081411.1 glycoside hydrolase family 13 protein [Bifidobacterium saguinibicoloris]